MWPHEFRTDLKVSLAAGALRVDWNVVNRNTNQDFPFTCALHSYFTVDTVGQVTVGDISGLQYKDKVREGKTFDQKEQTISFESEVDRVYLNAPDELTITDQGSNGPQTLRVRKTNIADAVIWNPWVATARKMGDLDDEDYNNFVCVEAAVAGTPVVLGAGKTWKSSMLLSRL